EGDWRVTCMWRGALFVPSRHPSPTTHRPLPITHYPSPPRRHHAYLSLWHPLLPLGRLAADWPALAGRTDAGDVRRLDAGRRREPRAAAAIPLGIPTSRRTGDAGTPGPLAAAA